ncbi:DUF4232 domain-containing protein [Microtetraspora fusca]|uniref:DUF4232 domain-containing protein n=1 Tax=Microtetraspora fusca TaxID=1997 RepID=UPI0008317D12|nr:DUF4232 domain-containing protein [Microtetraspora fusca]
MQRTNRTSRAAAASAVAASLLLSAACGSAASRTSGSSGRSDVPSTAAAAAMAAERTATPGSAGPADASAPAAHAAPPAAPAAAPVGRCRTGTLRARVGTTDAGAGQRYAPLVLTNTGSRTCWVYGFVGLIMIDGSGDALRTRTRREAVQPRRVTLRPGAAAHARLHWTVVPSGTETSCPRSARLMIIPPDEVAHLEIPFTAEVCGDGKIDVRPMEPGTTL